MPYPEPLLNQDLALTFIIRPGCAMLSKFLTLSEPLIFVADSNQAQGTHKEPEEDVCGFETPLLPPSPLESEGRGLLQGVG